MSANKQMFQDFKEVMNNTKISDSIRLFQLVCVLRHYEKLEEARRK